MTDRRKLFEEIEAQEAQLSAANKKIMDKIVDYLDTAAISRVQAAEVRRDIAAMLLDGQLRGEDAHAIIGDDVQAFCDEAIRALPSQRVDAVLINVWVFVTTLWVFFAISYFAHLPQLVRAGEALYVPLSLDTLGNVIVFLCIIRGWRWVRKRRGFKEGWRNWIVPVAVLFVLAAIGGVMLAWLGEMGVWKVHVTFFAGMGCVPYVLWRIIKRRIDRE